MYQDPVGVAIALVGLLASTVTTIFLLIVGLGFIGLIDLDVLGSIVRRCLEVAGE